MYTTFFINPVSDTGTSLTPVNRDQICGTARALMVKKGLTQGDATADLLVNIVSVDSSRAAQRAGRPLNDWYRLFHGEGTGPGQIGGGEPVGTLLPEKLLGSVDTGREIHGDTSVLRIDSPAPRADSASIPPPKPRSYAYGTLIIDVIDKDKRILLWEGVAEGPVDVPMKDPDKHLSGVVTRLLDHYSPAGSPGQTPK